MPDELTQAEESAAQAGAAMVRLLDFSLTVVNELTKTITSISTLRKTRAEPVRYSIRDPYVVHRYTTSQGDAEALLHRYVFSYFIVPFDVLSAAGGGRIIPFLMASVINDERRAPSLVYGILRNAQGRERNEEAFIQHYLLWLNEGLARVKDEEARDVDGAWRVDGKELRARAESQVLTADVSFLDMRLLDFSPENMPERAETIGLWYRDELRRAGERTSGEPAPQGPSAQPVKPEPKSGYPRRR